VYSYVVVVVFQCHHMSVMGFVVSLPVVAEVIMHIICFMCLEQVLNVVLNLNMQS
jgi:hypothetical protein